jgi:hypothetical protein
VTSFELRGRWKRLEDEKPEAYVGRLLAFGDRNSEILKGLRKNWNWSLEQALPLVVTDSEIEMALKYHYDRGVSREGIVRVMKREFNLVKERIDYFVGRSGLWD